MIQRWRWW